MVDLLQIINDIYAVGFTGTQIGMSADQCRELEKLWLTLKNQQDKRIELHHGDCVGGDEQAHDIAKKLGFRIVIHPPIIETSRAFCSGADEIRQQFDYLVRNHHIVNESNHLYVGPKTNEEELRSGTWATYRYCRKLYKPYTILYRVQDE